VTSADVRLNVGVELFRIAGQIKVRGNETSAVIRRFSLQICAAFLIASWIA
jgi:hypothetical protein